jgi:predicted nucleic acid-binding protein
VYCYTSTELEKREKAQRAAKLPNTIISTQVLQEFSNTLRRKFQIPWDKISDGLHEIQKDFEVYINTEPTIFRACKIAEKYSFSFYDSLIVAAALESGCTTLFSEDLQHEQIIEGKLKILNPFRS